MERLTKVMDKYLSEAKKKVLTLAVSKEWFDMIVSGEKNEEYLFKNGYYDDSPKVEKEIESITIGKPKKGLCPDKWLDTEFFIIKFK